MHSVSCVIYNCHCDLSDVVHRALYLRRDEVTDGKCRDQLLSIAAKTVEEYYVAPPGESFESVVYAQLYLPLRHLWPPIVCLFVNRITGFHEFGTMMI